MLSAAEKRSPNSHGACENITRSHCSRPSDPLQYLSGSLSFPPGPRTNPTPRANRNSKRPDRLSSLILRPETCGKHAIVPVLVAPFQASAKTRAALRAETVLSSSSSDTVPTSVVHVKAPDAQIKCIHTTYIYIYMYPYIHTYMHTFPRPLLEEEPMASKYATMNIGLLNAGPEIRKAAEQEQQGPERKSPAAVDPAIMPRLRRCEHDENLLEAECEKCTSLRECTDVHNNSNNHHHHHHHHNHHHHPYSSYYCYYYFYFYLYYYFYFYLYLYFCFF